MACALVGIACERISRAPGADGGDAGLGASRAASEEGRSPVASSAQAAPNRAVVEAPQVPAHPIERALEGARIVALTPRDLAAGVFDASLKLAGDDERRPARISFATIDEPHAHRRPLAYSKLARALGAHGVPIAVLRRVGAGELADLLEGQKDARIVMEQRASVQNDGTIDALITTVGAPASPWSAPAGREIAVHHSAEVEAWSRWALSPSPAPSERTGLLRGYIEMLVLDYLSANVLRRTVIVDDARGSLLLVDNTTAFPLHVDPGALHRILGQLRGCARFPEGLREALSRFDRAGAASALAPSGFDTWLLSPRSLVGLDERRAGLLTLIEAKIEERKAAGVPSGERAVLSL
jgi:hypothetical protein